MLKCIGKALCECCRTAPWFKNTFKSLKSTMPTALTPISTLIPYIIPEAQRYSFWLVLQFTVFILNARWLFLRCAYLFIFLFLLGCTKSLCDFNNIFCIDSPSTYLTYYHMLMVLGNHFSFLAATVISALCRIWLNVSKIAEMTSHYPESASWGAAVCVFLGKFCWINRVSGWMAL